MRRHLPSLQALEAVEAVARAGTVLRAADQLCLTPSAVSRQVRTVERACRQRLFERRREGFILTAPGRDFLAATEAALTCVDRALRRMRPDLERESFTVCCETALAELWLLPCLSAIEAGGPTARAAVDLAESPAMLAGDPDLILRFADAGERPTCPHDHLFAEVIAPVLAPTLVPQRSDGWTLLDQFPRFTDRLHPRGWEVLLSGAPVAHRHPTGQEMRYASTVLCLRAAEAGLGLALAVPQLVACELASRRLRAVLPWCPTGRVLLAAYPNGFARRPSLRHVRARLLARAAGCTGRDRD